MSRLQMRVLDLFSGIGGFSLGLERAGMETVAFCEIDKFCHKVLKKHWPDVPIHDNIKELDGKQYRGAIDVVCGGYPCQPFSVAGNQLGDEDERHLWPEMLRIIRSAKPRWIICENVYGHIELGLDSVISSMEIEGYAVRTFIIPACAIGARHQRNRLWIVGYAEHNGSSTAKIDGSSNETSDHYPQREGEASELTRASGRTNNEALADSECGVGQAQLQRQQRLLQEKDCGWQTDRLSARNIPAGRYWDVEPAVGRVADGIPDRAHRLKSLGNAVVPQIPEIIGRAILSHEWADNAVVGELNPYVWDQL